MAQYQFQAPNLTSRVNLSVKSCLSKENFYTVSVDVKLDESDDKIKTAPVPPPPPLLLPPLVSMNKELQ